MSAPIADGVAMLDLESGKHCVLAEVAASIWERLAEPVRPAALYAALTDVDEVTSEQCRAEVLAFLENANARGLVRIVA